MEKFGKIAKSHVFVKGTYVAMYVKPSKLLATIWLNLAIHQTFP